MFSTFAAAGFLSVFDKEGKAIYGNQVPIEDFRIGEAYQKMADLGVTLFDEINPILGVVVEKEDQQTHVGYLPQSQICDAYILEN